MRSILFLLLCLILPASAQSWNGLSVGTGPVNSSSYQLIQNLDPLFRNQMPSLGLGLLPRSQPNFEVALAELKAGRLDLAILPLKMIQPEEVQVLSVLWKVSLIPFRLEAQKKEVELDDGPLYATPHSSILETAGLTEVQPLDAGTLAEQIQNEENGVYLFEVIGHPRVIKGMIGHEIYPQNLSPPFVEQLKSKVPWLEEFGFSYKLKHSGVGFTLVLAARADLDLELGNQLYRFLLYPPKTHWPKPYLMKRLLVKKTVGLEPVELQHKAISYVKPDEKR